MSKKTKPKKQNIIKPLLGSVREFKKPSIITPIFMAVEAFCECLIPWFAGQLITTIQADGANLMQEILKYGGILIALALCSLMSGVLAGRFAATASCGFAKNLRHDLFYRVQKFSFANVDFSIVCKSSRSPTWTPFRRLRL